MTNAIFLNLENNDSYMDSGAAGYRLFHRAGYIYSLEDLTGSGTLASNITNWIDVVKANNSNGGAATTLITGAANNFLSHPSTPAPLLAATAGDGNAAPLSQAQLGNAVAAAIQLWASAGATDVQLDAMRAANVSVADMGGLYLGLTRPGSVLIDSDAAGHGWDDMDLLTAVAHELGHAAGMAHDEGHALMSSILGAGGSPTPEAMFEAEPVVFVETLPWGDMTPLLLGMPNSEMLL
jgi:hypothetical protein